MGIGRTAHIGFNEPGSHLNSQTRTITLHHLTRFDASSSFKGIENVRESDNHGIKSILDAKKIILMAWVVILKYKKAVEGEISDKIPTTYLQNHKNTTLILNEAASELTRIKSPWLVNNLDWNNETVSKPLLSVKNKKSILKLTDEDYNQNGMSDRWPNTVHHMI